MVSIAGSKMANVSFGAIDFQTKDFYQFAQIDGLVGLAGNAGTANTFSQLFLAGAFAQEVFAMCFVEGSQSNGSLTFGGADPRLYHGSIQYTENVQPQPGYYGMNVDLGVNGQSVAAATSSIIDSGTNILLLPTPMYNALSQRFLSLCTQFNMTGICTGTYNSSATLLDGFCYDLTQEDFSRFPNITFSINSTTGSTFELIVPPAAYLVPLRLPFNPSSYCFAVLATGPTGFFIIGDTVMSGYYSVFNIASQQIGWAPVNTQTCGSLQV